MAIHASSSVQRARQELAGRLREIRRDAGLTGRALARAAAWPESKVSKIEGTKQSLSDDDIRAWCRVCDAEDQAADLIAISRGVEAAYLQWRRLHASGMRHAQESRVDLYKQTRIMRIYTSTVVPGLFQVAAYATALMRAITTFQGTPDDVEAAVAARMDRNRVLHEQGHRYLVIAEESVLRYQLGDAETMAAQLGHLLAAMSLPSVVFGVIPFAASERPLWPLETFTLFDEARVHVEALTAQVTITAPSETETYRSAFDRMAGLAVHGAAARALIADALTSL